MMVRILVFSLFASFLFYIPFYYFAPFYCELYQHVDIWTVNWWNRWPFSQHNGIQIYVAFALVYLTVALTAFLEYVYFKFPVKFRGLLVALSGLGGLVYLWLIGFHPPVAETGFHVQNFMFVCCVAAAALAFVHFLNNRVAGGLLVLLIISACLMHPAKTGIPADYFYFLTPALRTINGYPLNQSYFQYDHLISSLGMAWMKFQLPLDRFFVVAEIFYAAFFIGIYIMARKLFFNKPLAVYFILSLIIIRMYGSLGWTVSLQGNPLRLDLWLVVLVFVFWRGIEHWSVGLALGFLLVFHHAFGMIYSISYTGLVLALLFFDNDTRRKFPRLILNAGLMGAGLLINHFWIASKTAPALNYIKYNISFMPIDPKSFFWFIPGMIATAGVLLWKRRAKISRAYLQTGLMLLVFSAGNLLYFFGRSHENNLLNISASLWLAFFMLIDLALMGSQKDNRLMLTVIGLLITALTAFFYSDTTSARIIHGQIESLSNLREYLEPDQPVNLDLNTVKRVTGESKNVVFLSTIHDLEYYYHGGYTPPAFAPFDSMIFSRDTMNALNSQLAQGAYLIVPEKEAKPLIETILVLKAKYVYQINDFVYISNNPPYAPTE